MDKLKGKYVYHRFRGWLWYIEGVGPRRLIGRYLFTQSRKYLNRRVFERYVAEGTLTLYNSMDER